jgi:hypothetical protein
MQLKRVHYEVVARVRVEKKIMQVVYRYYLLRSKVEMKKRDIRIVVDRNKIGCQ